MIPICRQCGITDNRPKQSHHKYKNDQQFQQSDWIQHQIPQISSLSTKPITNTLGEKTQKYSYSQYPEKQSNIQEQTSKQVKDFYHENFKSLRMEIKKDTRTLKATHAWGWKN